MMDQDMQLCRNCHNAHEKQLAAERERANKAEAELHFYQEREKDICKALPGLSDGGKYRTDIISCIGRLIEDKERAEADVVAVVEKVKAFLADHLPLLPDDSFLGLYDVTSTPHPGDPLREELELERNNRRALEKQVIAEATTAHEAQAEAKRHRDALERVCKSCASKIPHPCTMPEKHCDVYQALNAGKEDGR
jgi:hypothetical protein